jgi:hypothetical protein
VLLAGARSADSTAPGATVAATTSLLDGVAGVGKTADGQTITVTATTLAGAGQASSSKAGVQMSANASLLAGSVSAQNPVHATANGQVLYPTTVYLPGTVGIGKDASGVTLPVTGTILPGLLYPSDVTASGVVLTASTALLDGETQVSLGGTLLGAQVVFLPGLPVIDADAAGQELPGAVATLLDGQCLPSAVAEGALFQPLFDLLPGGLHGDNMASGVDLTPVTTSLMVGILLPFQTPHRATILYDRHPATTVVDREAVTVLDETLLAA